MAILSDFRTRFPEFSGSSVDQYVPILEPVMACYYGGVYGSSQCGDEIILNLMAHLLTGELAASEGAGKGTPQKGVSSKSVGSVSVSYEASTATQSQRNAWLMTTLYGQRFILLTRKRQWAVFV